MTSRRYRDETDYERIRALLREILRLEGPPVDCTVGDLDWWRFSWCEGPHDIGTARLWEDEGGRLVAVAWFGAGLVDLFVHPRHRDLEDAMLAWAETEQVRVRAEASGEGGNGRRVLTAFAFEGDGRRRALLEARGYVSTVALAWRFERPLDEPLPSVAVPSGYVLRSLEGEHDLPARVAVHHASFGTDRATVEAYRHLQTAPGYRLDLDLVAVAPDTSFAASALLWFDEATGTGVFEPLGCHPDHRRRGVTRALLAEGLARLAALGATRALVGTSAENTAAVSLYDALGFRRLDRLRTWKKTLAP